MFNFFKRSKNRITPIIVKPGDTVKVEWNQIQGTIGNMTCINNDTYTKKLHLRITWDNGTNDEVIFSYNSKELKNFNLLNPHLNKKAVKAIPAFDN